MMTPHESSLQSSDELTRDCLDPVRFEDLIPAGYPGGGSDKYLVAGRPELLVRYFKGGERLSVVRKAADIYNELPDYGIDALPYVPIVLNDEPYVLTLRVTGENLTDVLKNGKGDEIAGDIDALWANLTSYAVNRKQQDKFYATDIFAPQQYMYGTVTNETDPRLWLVDLGDQVARFSESPEGHEYAHELLDMVNTILSLEKSLRQPLAQSRRVLDEALETMDIQRFIKRGQDALRSSTPMEFPDDFIYFE